MSEHINAEGNSAEVNATATSDRSDIAAGIRQTLPVGMGLIPLGLAFGLLIAQTGLSWWWAPIFSFVVYAGSMEFLAVGLVMAHTGLLGCAVTSFMVNFRHVFYGLTFPRDRIHLVSAAHTPHTRLPTSRMPSSLRQIRLKRCRAAAC